MTNLYFFHLHACYSIFQNFFCAGIQFFVVLNSYEAIIIKRNSQFTMNVDINGEIVKCHCPATTRIGDIDLAGVHCLVSKSDDPKRKL